MKLLIRNLPRSLTEEALLEMVSAIGKTQSCNLVIDKATGASKGFAFVEVPKPGEAKAVIKELNGKELDGLRIRVKKAESRKEDSSTPPPATPPKPSVWKGKQRSGE